MTIFLTSDDHFDHTNVIGYSRRYPFMTLVEEPSIYTYDVDLMNETLIENWNNVVGPTDTVYVLGDICMGHRHKSLQYLTRLHGIRYLVPGNHDYCHPMHAREKKYDEYMKMYQEYFDDILGVTHELDDFYLLSHMPYPSLESDLDYQGRDYSEWYPKDEGKILLHGHVHELYKTAWSHKNSLMINVGVDQWDYTPVALEVLKKLAENMIRDRDTYGSSVHSV